VPLIFSVFQYILSVGNEDKPRLHDQYVSSQIHQHHYGEKAPSQAPV